MDNDLSLEEKRFIGDYEPSAEIVKHFEHRKKRPVVKKRCIHVTIDDHKHVGEKVYLTPYLTFTQKEAADLLDMSPSTLSKLWKKISDGRRWPHLIIKKIDREISCYEKLRLMNSGKSPEKCELATLALSQLYHERKTLLPECYIKRVTM